MKSCRFAARSIAAALIVLFMATGVSAQSTGLISGTVTDTSGGVLPGVTVTVANVNTATVGQIQGPHFYRWDLSLRKNFRVSHYRAEFRADAFNALNRVNYNNPVLSVTSADFGTIGSAKTPREFQFSLRFEF